MLHRLYATSPPTELLSYYCNIGPTPAVYFLLFEGQVRLRQFLGRSLRLGQARGPGTAATSPFRSCKTTCQQVGCVVQWICRRSEVKYSEFANVLLSCFIIQIISKPYSMPQISENQTERFGKIYAITPVLYFVTSYDRFIQL